MPNDILKPWQKIHFTVMSGIKVVWSEEKVEAIFAYFVKENRVFNFFC